MSVRQIDGKIEAEGEIRFTERFWKDLEDTISQSPLLDELMKALQEPEPLDWYDIRNYELSEARNDFRIDDFPDEGDILLVISCTGNASIKLNSRNVDSFDLTEYRRIKHSYTEIYLTNTAQAGARLKLLFGRGDWELEETTPTVDLSGLLDQDNLGQITDPDKLADGLIRAAKIATHAVEAAKIALNAVTETKIAPDSIDTPHLKANIITAAKIAAGTITGDLIASNVIATRHLIAAIVTAAKIATGAVTADKIDALAVTTEKLDAFCVIAAKIATGTITADKIAAIDADLSTITAGDGVITIDANGIVAVKDAVTMFQLSAATGAAYFKGNVEAGALVAPVGTDKWAT